MVIVDNIPQGSIDWIIARLHRLTASEFKSVFTPKGELSNSVTCEKYVCKLIAALSIDVKELRKNAETMNDWELQKYIAHYTGDKFTGNAHTARGHEFEAEALAATAERHNLDLQPCDMVIMGDDPNGVISASPDSLGYSGGKAYTGCETKVLTLFNYYYHMRQGILPKEFELQVHGSMAVCDFDTWHFGSFFPGKPIFSGVIHRNELTDSIQKSLPLFRDYYEDSLIETNLGLRELAEGKLIDE